MWLASTTRWTALLEKWRQDANRPQTQSREAEEGISEAVQSEVAEEVNLAAPQGFEPRYADPESAVLPLNEGAECVDS
jgi:hypothetical protein